MKGKYKIILFIILLLYLVTKIFLPVVAEREIKQNIVKNVDDVQVLEVDADSFPVWEILLSRIDRVEVKASNLVVDNLCINSFITKHRNLYIEDKKIKGENTDLKLVITEQALNEYISKKYPGLNKFNIKFMSQQAYLSGQVNFFNKKVNIQLAGKFNVQEKNIINFEPLNLKIEKLEIPGDLIKKFIEDTGFVIDLNNLNISLNVEKIKIDSSRIYLLGGIYTGKAGLQ